MRRIRRTVSCRRPVRCCSTASRGPGHPRRLRRRRRRRGRRQLRSAAREADRVAETRAAALQRADRRAARVSDPRHPHQHSVPAPTSSSTPRSSVATAHRLSRRTPGRAHDAGAALGRGHRRGGDRRPQPSCVTRCPIIGGAPPSADPWTRLEIGAADMTERTLLRPRRFGAGHRVDTTAEGLRVEVALVRAERQPSGAIRAGGRAGASRGQSSSGDTRWVFIDGEVFEFETGRPPARRRRASAAQGSLDGADAGDGTPGRRQPGRRASRQAGRAAGSRSDEDGAAGPRARRRDGDGRALPGGRARAAGPASSIELEP